MAACMAPICPNADFAIASKKWEDQSTLDQRFDQILIRIRDLIKEGQLSAEREFLCALQMRCFFDYKAGGGLAQILASVFKFKTELGW